MAATDLGGLAASETFNITAAPAPTTYSLFSASNTPTQTNLNDGQQLEVGVKFQSNVAGDITGIKFYRSANDTGQNVVDLWSATGTKLASATFTQYVGEWLADRELCNARHHRRQHHLCRVLPHHRRLRGDRQLLHQRRHQRPADGPRRHAGGNGVYALWRIRHRRYLPD